MGMSAVEFIQQSGLSNRNIVLFKDPFRACYAKGLSENINDLDALVEWQLEFVNALEHVTEIYCVGVSSGALPAIYSGYHLSADIAWSFGARPLTKKFWGLSMEEIRDNSSTNQVDLKLIREYSEIFAKPNGRTEYRLYYSPLNETDSFVHDQISAWPNTVAFPVEVNDDYPYADGPEWHHKVVSILAYQGKINDLFPPFAPSSPG